MHQNKTIIIGLGNEYISDDGIGIHTIRELKNNIPSNNYKIEELSIGGIELLDHISGYERAIIVDAFITQTQPSGTIYRYIQPATEDGLRLKSSHQIDLPQVLGLARALNIKIPNEIIIFGVEAEDITTFALKCTKAVEAAIPRLVKFICSELKYTNDKLNSKSLEIIN